MPKVLYPLNVLDVFGADDPEPVPTVMPLRLTNVGTSAQVATLANMQTNADINYRINGEGEYIKWIIAENDPTLQPGDYIEIQGKNTDFYMYQICGFRLNLPDLWEASGSIMSLVYGDELNESNNLILPENARFTMMFYQCTGLLTPPELPAATISVQAYTHIFYGCTSLQYAPEIYAESLPDYSLGNAFAGCTLISSITVHFTAWNDTQALVATYNWLQNVSPTGVFRCPAELDTTKRNSSHIPAGWTVETF